METEGSKRGIFGIDEVEIEVCDILRIVDKSTARRAAYLYVRERKQP